MFFRRESDIVAQDASRLIREDGDRAFAVAADLSWREDAGLIRSAKAGHWYAVQMEIARRTGRTILPSVDLRIAGGTGAQAA